jgi:hypothetical protein
LHNQETFVLKEARLQPSRENLKSTAALAAEVRNPVRKRLYPQLLGGADKAAKRRNNEADGVSRG